MNQHKQSIDEIFFGALQLSSAGQRTAFLDAACADDPSCRRRVEELLAAYPQAANFLEAPAASGAGILPAIEALDQTPAPLGTSIGPYKLLEQIGEGGMGLVYMAEQMRPVKRLVALKLIKPGMDTKQVIARFEAERQALALMDHANIAKVFDAGTTENGRPFFVMELVRGIPINELCDEKRLPIRQRLELFIQVCQAVQHAHQKGIIHRDVKPTNVLVTMHDTLPVPKIIDFGIAKALGPSLTEHTLHTGFSQLIGTPLYMSPEQAEFSQFGVDTRSDVYSLGVLLYELLTGTTPFDKDRLKSASFDELRRIIREEEPETVSTRLARTRRASCQLARDHRRIGVPPVQNQTPSPTPDTAPHSSTDCHPPTPATSTSHKHSSPTPRSAFRIPRLSELDWIVTKSLEKDRNRRYESASSFAADIECYLTDEPVQACPSSAFYRARKFARRHRTWLTTALLVTASLIICTLVSTWQAIRATAAEAQANASEMNAKAAEKEAVANAQAQREAKEAESVERRRAERNFQVALEAIDRLLQHVGSEELRSVPLTHGVRKAVLDDALAFYEKMEPNERELPDVQFRVAQTWMHVARIVQLTKERIEQADARSVEIHKKLVQAHPGRADFRDGLAQACLYAANHSSDTHQKAELYRLCIQTDDHLAEISPVAAKRDGFAGRRVRSRTFLARLAATPEERLVGLDEAIKIGEALEKPADGYIWQALMQKAQLIVFTSPAEADDLCRRSYQLNCEWAQRPVLNNGDDNWNAGHIFNCANFLSQRHPDEAERLFDEALDLSRNLRRAKPSSYGQVVLAGQLRTVAKFKQRLTSSTPVVRRQRLQQATALLDEAIKNQRLAGLGHQAADREPDAQFEVGGNSSNKGTTLAQLQAEKAELEKSLKTMVDTESTDKTSPIK